MHGNSCAYKDYHNAPGGDDTDALFIGIREFPTERVILLAPDKQKAQAEKVRKELERFKVPVQVKQVAAGNVWEAMFRAVGEIKSVEKDNELLINASSGDRSAQCVATSAAYVNGNLKSEGMKQLGLVDTYTEKGRTHIKLSLLGRMLIKGYVQ